MLTPSGRSRLRKDLPGAARRGLTAIIVAVLLAGCAETKMDRESEGSVAFRSGDKVSAGIDTYSSPGPTFLHPGVLVPAYEPVWQSAWIGEDEQNRLTQGAAAGFLTGISFAQMLPIGLAFWPAAVGIVAGATAMGMLGVAQKDPEVQRISPPDQIAIAEATKSLRPDRLFRESMAKALARRLRMPIPAVVWQQAWGPDTAGTDPLIEARDKGLDGVLDLRLDAIGLAVGEEKDTFGVFVQVRVRALDAKDGQLRYEKAMSYGPGQPVMGLPRADFHTLELLAMDKAALYRHLASQAISRMANLLAEDAVLPLAAP